MFHHKRTFKKGQVVIVNMSGRGDKDVAQMEAWDAAQAVKRRGAAA
jgi:tryptophan synthase beta subunit